MTDGQYEPDDGCLSRVERSLPTLDGVRRRIAEYLVAQPWEAQGLSIGELADRAEVSENAISRFAKTLRYSGYREFAQALSLDLGRRLGTAHSHPLEIVAGLSAGSSTSAELVSRVFELELSCITNTAANLDGERLEGAINALCKAARILFIGTGSAAPICQMAHYRFSNIRLLTTWTSDPMFMVSEVEMLNPGDVIVGVSHSGRTRATYDVLQYAHRRGVTTISITAIGHSPIAEVADINLVVFGPRFSPSSGQFGARVSEMVLMEAIATAISVKKYGESVPELGELGDAQARINNLSEQPQREHGVNRRRSSGGLERSN